MRATALLPALLAPALLVAACHPDEDDPAADDPAADDPAAGSGPVALPPASSVLGLPGTVVEAEACAALPDDSGDTGASADTGAAEDDGLLPVERCLRLSPEEEEHDHDDDSLVGGGDDDDADPGSTEDPMPALPPPPCTFGNLIGSLALAGDPADPLVTYCDSDDDGGMRIVRAERDQEVRTWLLDPKACIADPDSVALTATESGFDLLYVQPSSTTDVRLMAVELAATGGALDEPVDVGLGRAPQQLLRLFPPEGDRLLVLDQDQGLALLRLDPDDGLEREVVELADTGVLRFDATLTEQGLVVAACTDQATLRLWRLDGSGEILAQATEDGWCDSFSRPSLAVAGSDLLLAISTYEGGGWLRTLDADLQVLSETFLGVEAQVPAVAWDGLRFVSVDASGQVAAWSGELEALGSWEHPAIAGATDLVDGFRMAVDTQTWTFLTHGVEYGPGLSEGHIHTSEWVELSTSPAPTL